MQRTLLVFLLLSPAIVWCQGSSVTLSISPGGGNRRIQNSSPEGQSFTLCLRALTTLQSDAVISVQSRDGTAQAPSDYGSIDTDLTFGPGSSRTQCVSTQLVDDGEDEGDEVFSIDVQGAAGSALSDFSADVTVIITEDSNGGGNTINVGGGGGNGGGNIINGGNVINVGGGGGNGGVGGGQPPRPATSAYAYMELFSYYTSEEAGTVEVCAVVAGQLNSSAVIVLRTFPHTARSGDDYIDVEEELTFLPMADGCSKQCVNIAIVNEGQQRFEPYEYFFVLLNTSSPQVQLAGPYATVVIENAASAGGQSSPNVVLEQNSYEVTEGQGEVEVCAVLTTDLSRYQWVFGSLQTLPAPAAPKSQATAIVDFINGFKNVFFWPGSSAGSRVCMTVDIIQDDQDECEELFLVKYFGYGSSARASALVRILDQ